jgi:arylsulfatase
MNPTRREFLRRTGALGVSSGLIGATWPSSARACGSASARPNIVYIFSDQQHGGALGCVDSFFETPHLDRFAGDAVRFARAFCSTPQCSPSRSSMMTGLYPSKTGVMGKKSLRADLDRWIAENDDPFYSLKTTPLVRRTGARS